MAFGGGPAQFGQPTEMFTVGKDKAWTDLGHPQGYSPYAVTLDNEIYIQGEKLGKNNMGVQYLFLSAAYFTKIKKWNKETLDWEEVADTGVTRYSQTNMGSAVPIDSGIEKWCLDSSIPNGK